MASLFTALARGGRRSIRDHSQDVSTEGLLHKRRARVRQDANSGIQETAEVKIERPFAIQVWEFVSLVDKRIEENTGTIRLGKLEDRDWTDS